VIEGEAMTAIRTLASRGMGKKAIAREVGVALNTVRGARQRFAMDKRNAAISWSLRTSRTSPTSTG
jgi:orotate phosphoribosyltransferase-like protein